MPTVMKKKQDAYNALESWMNQQPQKTNSAYEGALDVAVQQLMGQQSFGSGYTAGTDPNVQAYRKNYAASLRDAANTAAAQTAALGGGYGTDYAASAAGQTAQLAAPQGYDAQQMLRQLASSGYKANQAANQAAVQALLADVGLGQSADQLNQDNWAAYRDILAGQAAAAADEELGFWSNLWNTAKQLAQAGMDIYDGVKGYQQQEFDNAMRVYEAAYGMNRDAIGDARYEREYMDSRSDVAWNQKMEEQRFGLDKQYTQAQIDAILQDTALAAQAAAAGYGGSGSSSGGGGSTGLSDSEWLSYFKEYRNAVMEGDQKSADYLAAILGIEPGDGEGGTGSTGGAGSPAGGGTDTQGGAAPWAYTPTSKAIRSEAALPVNLREGAARARGYIQQGASVDQVMMNLIGLGYSDQEVAAIMNVVG